MPRSSRFPSRVTVMVWSYGDPTLLDLASVALHECTHLLTGNRLSAASGFHRKENMTVEDRLYRLIAGIGFVTIAW